MVKKIFLFSLMFLVFQTIGSQNKDTIYEIGYIKPEIMPFKEGLCDFMCNNIIYPIMAVKDNIQGTVIIEFYIDKTGFTTNHKIIRGVREDVNNEVLRVAKLLIFDSPAYLRGNPIQEKYLLALSFSLVNNISNCNVSPNVKCEDLYSHWYKNSKKR
jgi:TonB family protein